MSKEFNALLQEVNEEYVRFEDDIHEALMASSMAGGVVRSRQAASLLHLTARKAGLLGVPAAKEGEKA